MELNLILIYKILVLLLILNLRCLLSPLLRCLIYLIPIKEKNLSFTMLTNAKNYSNRNKITFLIWIWRINWVIWVRKLKNLIRIYFWRISKKERKNNQSLERILLITQIQWQKLDQMRRLEMLIGILIMTFIFRIPTVKEMRKKRKKRDHQVLRMARNLNQKANKRRHLGANRDPP